MTWVIAVSALLFTLLGVAYVKGYDVVRSHSPEHLVHFYLIMATIRMLTVGTAAALYILFAPNREDTMLLAVIYILMYATMMVVTLYLRH